MRPSHHRLPADGAGVRQLSNDQAARGHRSAGCRHRYRRSLDRQAWAMALVAADGGRDRDAGERAGRRGDRLRYRVFRTGPRRRLRGWWRRCGGGKGWRSRSVPISGSRCTARRRGRLECRRTRHSRSATRPRHRHPLRKPASSFVGPDPRERLVPIPVLFPTCHCSPTGDGDGLFLFSADARQHYPQLSADLPERRSALSGALDRDAADCPAGRLLRSALCRTRRRFGDHRLAGRGS